MRKLSFVWLLPLLMLFAQQGAYRHQLEHLRPASSAPQERLPKPTHEADRLCENCLAFAHLADLTAPAIVVPLFVKPGFGIVSASALAALAAEALVARSRGPPRFL